MRSDISRCLKAGVAIANLFAASAFAGSHGTDCPLVGTCDTVVRPQPSPPGHLLLEIDLSCQFQHLGRTTGIILQDTLLGSVDTDGVIQIVLLSTFTFTAANGDELHSTMNGTGYINFLTGVVTFEGLEIWDGGTGRFSDATGTSHLRRTASLPTNTGFYSTVGCITY
jgi:hypothetical protein